MNSRQHQIKHRTNRTRGADSVLNRIADRIDLAIDVLTLGQYGAEQVPAAEAGSCRTDRRKHSRRKGGSRSRGACDSAPATTWDWPARRAASR